MADVVVLLFSAMDFDTAATLLGCDCVQHVPIWNYFRFLYAIFISSVTATWMLLPLEKVNPDGMYRIQVEILFLCALESK